MGKLATYIMTALVFALGASTISRADETTENKIKIEDVKPDTNTTPGNDIDETITNAKMRAETGSKNRYSFSSQLYYNGGSIQKPLAADRPDISGATGTTDTSLLGGQLFGKYNLSASNSLQLGVGLRWASPLQGAGMDPTYKANGGQKFDVDNPFVTYQHLYRWLGVQSALQLTPTYFTNSNLVHDGYISTFAISQNNIYELGTSRTSLGLYLLLQGGAYNNSNPAAEANQATVVWNIDPFVEYQFNDTFNLRAVTNLWNYEHNRTQAANTYNLDTIMESLGVGISVSRDIFLYPNLQFLPEYLRADRTNIAINTYVNL